MPSRSCCTGAELDGSESLGDRLLRGDPSIFTELLEILDEAVTIRDASGQIVYANRTALAHLGFESREQLQARSSRSIMDDYIVEDEHGKPLSIEDVPSVRLMYGRSAAPLLMRAVHRATGELHWNLLRATPLRNDDGDFIGAITVIEDVTAVKQAEVRTRVLAESGAMLASSLDYQQTLHHVANVAVPALADWCAVDLVDAENQRERLVTAHRDPAKRSLAARLRDFEPDKLEDGRALAQVVRSGVSVLHPAITDDQLTAAARSEDHLRLLRELGMRSVVMVPMRVPARTIGVMTLATAESRRRLTQDDLELAEQLARRAAVAVENARLHTTLAGVAETLQESLLPEQLPEIPRWEAASLYRPADTEQRIDVGGDFYELFERDGAWFGIIGDVTGRGVAAASLTALMRHGARIASRLEPSPSAILRRLDEALRHYSRGALCTALCLRLYDDRVVISSAGHPPAVLVGREGVIEAPGGGPLLGAFADADWAEETLPVAPEQLLFLYTDGVTETVGRDERFGCDRLHALLAQSHGRTPNTVLADLDAALDAFRSARRRDDVAALVLKPRR
ncbi:MAG: SpoIIE family protein phosphatase [Solirubrobacteraceae bacterium]